MEFVFEVPKPLLAELELEGESNPLKIIPEIMGAPGVLGSASVWGALQDLEVEFSGPTCAPQMHDQMRIDGIRIIGNENGA